MSIAESLLVSIFGMAIVFVILVALSLLIRFQSALINLFTKKKLATADGPVPEAVSAPIEASVEPKQVAKQEDLHRTETQRIYPIVYNKTNNLKSVKKYTAQINGKVYELEVEEVNGDNLNNQPAFPVTKPVPAPTAHPSKEPAAAGTETITSPMPGIVVDIKTTAGTKVIRGELLILLEAMKMENEIVAAKDGTVTKILTTKGASVEMGTPLVVIQ